MVVLYCISLISLTLVLVSSQIKTSESKGCSLRLLPLHGPTGEMSTETLSHFTVGIWDVSVV